MLVGASLDTRTGTDRREAAQHGRSVDAFAERQATCGGARDPTWIQRDAGKAGDVAQRAEVHARCHHRVPSKSQEKKSTTRHGEKQAYVQMQQGAGLRRIPEQKQPIQPKPKLTIRLHELRCQRAVRCQGRFQPGPILEKHRCRNARSRVRVNQDMRISCTGRNVG